MKKLLRKNQIIITAIGSSVLALPGVTFALFSGILFGPILGIILCSISATISASISFIISRFFLKDSVKPLIEKNKYLNEYLENYEKMSDNYRTLKHNLRNDLYLIKCSKEKDPVINKMYVKYTDDENWEGKISNIPSGLQGIIFLKMQYAETKNIKFIVDNKIDENDT